MEVIDSHTVNMTWNAPNKHKGNITRYLVSWRLGDDQYGANSTVDMYHVFGNLKPEQTISAAVAAVTQQGGLGMCEVIGNYSKEVLVTTPSLEEGEASLLHWSSATILSKHD